MVPWTPKRRRHQGTANHWSMSATRLVRPSNTPRKAVSLAGSGKATRMTLLYSKSMTCKAIMVAMVAMAVVVNRAEERE